MLLYLFVVAARDDYLLDTLSEMGVVTDEDVAIAQEEADSTGEGVVDTLISKEIIGCRACFSG